MNGDYNIGLRIKNLVDYFADGVNTRFAELIGTSEANIRNYRNGKMPKFDFIYNICTKLEINYEWFIAGKGEMLKHNIAGRDNVGTGNEIAGDNTGVIGNTGTVGNVGGNQVSIFSNNIKKRMNEDGVGIEFTQSTDSLQQRNAYLEARVKDLEMLNDSQANYNKMLVDTNAKLVDTNQKLLERILELTEKEVAEGARGVVSKAAHG